MNDTFALEKSSISNKERKAKKNKTFIRSARRLVEKGGWRYQLYKIIYRSKIFSFCLLSLILISSTAVILQTVKELKHTHATEFLWIEGVVTVLFTIEYILRLIVAPKPLRYACSPMGIVDFISIFPSYLSLALFNAVASDISYLLVIRLVRLFRLVRVFDLIDYSKYQREVRVLVQALKNSRRKIAIFILSVMISVTMIGSLMFLIEGEQNGFDSIPKGIYWAIVTITTVGYGDLAPQTALGQLLASLLMLLGFSTIVVFTSIVGAEIFKREEKKEIVDSKSCLGCGMPGHDADASYCKYCGTRLWG